MQPGGLRTHDGRRPPAAGRDHCPQAAANAGGMIMEKYDVGVVPVCNDDKHLLGMVTDRDIVIRNVITGKNPEESYVKDIMSSTIKTGTPNMTIDEACDAMSQWQVRRLPIVENNKTKLLFILVK